MGYSGGEAPIAASRPALNAFYRIAFRRLRTIAASLLQRERQGHTLQPIALVSEAFLKLRRLPVSMMNEEHFYRLAASAMEQVLVDSARAKSAYKRIPAQLLSELLPNTEGPSPQTEMRLAAKLVLEKLRAVDPVAAETVWLRSVEGLTLQEVSLRQKREMWRVRADCDFGLRWMGDQLTRIAGSRSPASSSDQAAASSGLRAGSAL